VRRLVPALLVVVAVAAGSGCGPEKISADQAAVVNGQAISVDLLTEAVRAGKRSVEQQTGQAPADGQQFARDQLQGLIQSNILLQGARADGVTVSEAEVQQRIDQLKQQVAARGLRYEDFLRQQQLTDRLLRLDWATRLAFQREATKLVPGRSDADLQRDLVQRKAEFLQVHVRHVLVADEATARKVRDELRSSGDWNAVARKYSTDQATKDRGGDLGFFKHGTMVPEFEAAAFAAKPGDITPVIKTQFGYHVIKVESHDETPLESVKPAIEKTLRQKKMQETLEAMKTSANATYDESYFASAKKSSALQNDQEPGEKLQQQQQQQPQKATPPPPAKKKP
jgi:foldase protein PrsA